MAKKPTNKLPEKITFHNKVNPLYREIHVDGAHGGITPRGLINISFFAERFPIPKSTDYSVLNRRELGSKLGDSIDSKTGIIREYEFGVYMSMDAVKSLSKFLLEKISEYEQLMKRNDSSTIHSK